MVPRDPDEEALSWGDERDATHVDPAAPANQPDAREDKLVRTSPTVTPEASDTTATAASDDTAGSQLSSTALVMFGVIGGAYLLYAVGWLTTVTRSGAPFAADQPFALIMYQLGQLLAVAAAPLWFVTTLILARPALVRRGLPWLLVGLVVLVPWPFILGA